MARLQRDLNREQIWRRHLEQQRSSGVTVRAYCLANTLRETSFFYWKKEITRRDRAAVPTAPVPPVPAFVPVAVINSPSDRTESAIEIRLACGDRVRARSGCDRDLLTDVLAMLRRPVTEDRAC